jgi:hypothetical protein
MPRRREAYPQRRVQERFSAQKIFNQARIHFEILGQKTTDPRLRRACEILGLPDPTTEEGLKKLQRIEEIAREAAAAGERPGIKGIHY